MNVKLFLEYLPWLRLPAYQLEILGIANTGYAATRQLETTPIKRVKPLALSDAPTSIKYLYSENDLCNLRFLAGITFWSEPKKLEQGWGFADMSEVNIVVAPTGQIEAYNAYSIRGIPGATDCLGLLAKDLESYLEALFYAQFNTSHFISGFPDEDPVLYERTILVAKHCSLIAGGYQYYDFWAGILGLPPEETVPE